MTAVAEQSVPVTPRAIEFMLMHVMRDRATFEMARSHLTPEMLNRPHEAPYRHIWQAAVRYYHAHSRVPQYEWLCTSTLDSLSAEPALQDKKIGGKFLDVAVELLQWIYNQKTNPDDALEPWAAQEIMRALLIERGPEDDMRRAFTTSMGRQVHNLPKLVQRAQERIQDISALGQAPIRQDNMPMKWAGIVRPRWPTGVEFVDRILGGGCSPGWVNVLIGPTGGGKTTLSMQIACEIARTEYKRKLGNMSNGLSVYFSYEDSSLILRSRASIYSARVSAETFKGVEDGVEPEFSGIGRLKTYEQKFYAGHEHANERLGELERMEQVRPWVNHHLVLVGNDEGSHGNGHIPEITAKLHAIQNEYGMPIKAVFIDWAGALVQNYLQRTLGQYDGGQMSLNLQTLTNRAKQEVAMPFDCVVWLPHQLKGTLTNMAPAKMPHHSQGQWCSTFADHAWYAFVLGVKDEEHNVCQFGATKTRHSASTPPTILRVDGALGRMTEVANHYEVDPITKRLTPKSEASKWREEKRAKQEKGPNVDFS
jgi:RecA/RadA recombinase